MAAARGLSTNWRSGLITLIAAVILIWGYNATPAYALTLVQHADINVSNAPGQAGAVVTYTVSANNVTGTANIFCSPASGSFFSIGTTSVQCTGSDSGGDEPSSMGFNVTVNDVDPPTVTVPADITTGGGPSGAIVNFSATGTDNSGVSPQVNCVPPSGSLFPLGPTIVTCTAMDLAGNTASDSFSVTVVLDTEPPEMTAPANITRNNDPGLFGAVVTYPTPIATDDNPGVVVVCVPPSGTFFPAETIFPQQGTIVTCTATDIGGNTATVAFTVTVVDVEPPSITASADITKNNDPNQAGAVVTYPAPVVSDNGPGTNVSCSPHTGAFFAIGTTTVICTATDVAGNTASASFSVTVLDVEPPVLTLPSNITVIPNVLGGTLIYSPPAVTDNGIGGTVSCTVRSGQFLSPGTHTITCTATDRAGNTDTASFTVHVEEPPPFINPLPATPATPAPTVAPTSVPTAAPTSSPTRTAITPVATATAPTPVIGGAPPGTASATPIAPRTGNGLHSAADHQPLALLLGALLLVIAGGGLVSLGRRA